MRRTMMESASTAEKHAYLQEEINSRNAIADKLVEKWSHKKGLGLDKNKLFDLYNTNPSKARNLAIVLENEERHLSNLTETQTSSAFLATPQTVVKIIRLGYPNSIRGDIFTEYAMTTAKDTMYKIETTYDRTVRGATKGDVMYESTADRYASELNEVDVTVTATTDFSGTFTVYPLRPYTLTVFRNKYPIGTDDGAGNITGTNISSGTIDYDTGAWTLVFSSALATTETLTLQYCENSEDSTLYSRQGQVNIQLVGYDFRAHPYPIGFSWSKNAEIQMDSALSQNAEDVMIQAGADELKKDLDFQALNLGYSGSRWTEAVEFDTDWAAAGADSDFAHTQSVTKYLKMASQKTYNALMRGGNATAYVAGAGAVAYLTMHKSWVDDNSMPPVGAYKVGTIGGTPVYQAPSDIVPTDEILCVYKNNVLDSNDSALVVGSYIPLYRTQTLELSSFHKETALAFFGDMRLNNPKYLTRVVLNNLPDNS